MKRILLFSLLILQFTSFAQTKEVALNGTLTNDKNEILKGLSVTLWENTDSTLSVISDSQGQFIINTTFNYDSAYILTFDYKYQSETDIIIYQPTDSVVGSNYTFDVQLVKNITASAEENAAIYFGKNKTSEITDDQGVIYVGNPKVLKKICPGVFGTIQPVGYCMIGKR